MLHHHQRAGGTAATPAAGSSGSPRATRRPVTALAVLTVLACATVLWACGSSSSTKTGTLGPAVSSGSNSASGGSTPGSFYGPATTVNGTTATVDVIDNDFSPKNLVVKAGTKVTFDATGHNQHDIVPDDPKLFDFTVKQEKLPPGSKVTFTFAKPGTYYYYCSLHATATAGSMRGVITVEP